MGNHAASMRWLGLALVLGLLVPPAGARAQEKKPFVIGLSLSLTGAFAQNAVHLKRGYDLWLKDVNARGGILGRPVQFVVYNDESDPTTGARLYEKLITQDKVDFVFSPYSSAVTSPVSTVTEKYQYPIIAAGASAATIWQRGYKWIFGVFSSGEKYAGQAVELAASLGAKTMAIVNQDTAFGKDSAEFGKKVAARVGIRVVMQEEYPKDAADFTPLLIKVKQAAPDLFLGGTYLPESIQIARQLKELGISLKMVALTIGPDQPDFIRALGKDAENFMSMSEWEPGIKTPGSDRFTKQYRDAHGEDPVYQAAGAYASGEMLEEAVRRAGSADRGAIRAFLAKYEGTTLFGPYAVDERGFQRAKGAYVIQIQNGRKQIVWPKEFSTAAPVYPMPAWGTR